MARKKQAKKRSLEEMCSQLAERYRGRLVPLLEGLAYRFTIWLPILADGKTVFTDQQQAVLYDLFHDCCGGLSQSNTEGFPPWSGSWLPQGTDRPVVDQHIMLLIYTLQNEEARLFFRQLKWVLQQEHIAAQQVVLIEQVPVHLVEAVETA